MLKNTLLTIRHKADVDAVMLGIKNNQFNFEELMECFFSDDWVLCQKSAWPVGVIAEKNPDLLRPFLPRMLENLKQPVHDAVIRNTLRAWQMMDIPETIQGEVYQQCFEYLANPGMAIAIRVFAMSVCSNIAMIHPALSAELIPLIEDHFDHSSAGFRSRAMKELKRLRTQKQN